MSGTGASMVRGSGAACVSSRGMGGPTRLANSARGRTCPMGMSARGSRVVRVVNSLAEGPRPVSSIEAAVKLTGEAKEKFVGQLQFGNGKEVEDNAMREAMKAAEAGLVEMDLKVSDELLEQAFERSRRVTAEYAKTFYLGAILLPLTPARYTHRVDPHARISTPPSYHPIGIARVGPRGPRNCQQD